MDTSPPGQAHTGTVSLAGLRGSPCVALLVPGAQRRGCAWQWVTEGSAIVAVL